MKQMCANAVKVSAVAVGCVLGVSGMAFGKAVPARTITFANGECTAKFVRSASGIVHETKRECVGDQNPWVDADVVIHYRPLAPGSRPNPQCDPAGLVTTFVYTNTDFALVPVFGMNTEYNACVYLEDPVVDAGTIDSADADGIVTAAVPLAGDYQVCVRGTWANRGGLDQVDAEYVSQDNWLTSHDGLPPSDPLSAALGPNWGDVQVNGQFVDWGAFSADHKYCTTVTLADAATLTLGVFDGTSPDGYADNVGSLTYTVMYLGQ